MTDGQLFESFRRVRIDQDNDAHHRALLGNQLAAAVAAVNSGMCETALVYHHACRMPYTSRAASKEPMRRRANTGLADPSSWWGTGHVDVGPNSMVLTPAYAAWADHYLTTYGDGRETLGRIAINSRTNASLNPNAVYSEPLAMDEYLGGRMVRDPLTVYDMDVPVDGADAFVVTTTDRARDLPNEPVLVHAATLGNTDFGSEEQLRDPDHSGQAWFEFVGYCGRGEGGALIEQHWDHEQQRIVIDGRIPVNSNGGSLSEEG